MKDSTPIKDKLDLDNVVSKNIIVNGQLVKEQTKICSCELDLGQCGC
jgi:hypothetical protein